MATNTDKENSFALTTLAAKPKVMAPHEVMLSSNLQKAVGIQAWLKFVAKAGLQALDENLGATTRKVTDGDMRPIECMLYRQTQTLETIFTNLIRRAAGNDGLKQFQVNLTLTLTLAPRAQAQCRANRRRRPRSEPASCPIREASQPQQRAKTGQQHICRSTANHWQNLACGELHN